MTTIEIYERVPYNEAYHRYTCRWNNSTWFFTSSVSYNHHSSTVPGNQLIKDYTHLVDTIIVNKSPENVQDFLDMLRVHMPELFI